MFPLLGVFYFITKMPYVVTAEEDLSGVEGFTKGIGFAFRNLKVIIPGGIVYMLVSIVLRSIPIINYIEQLVDFPIMISYLHMIYRDRHQKPPFGTQMFQYQQDYFSQYPGYVPPPGHFPYAYDRQRGMYTPPQFQGQMKPPKLRN